MLNEILTGKATLEGNPPQPAPSPPSPSSAYAAIDQNVRRSENSHKLLAAILGVAVAAGIFVFKRGMREAYNRDMAEMNAGRGATDDLTNYIYVADDPYVSEARRFASEMCACRDKPCAWNVKSLAARWSRSATKPTDERLLAAAIAEVDRYTECALKLIPDG